MLKTITVSETQPSTWCSCNWVRDVTNYIPTIYNYMSYRFVWKWDGVPNDCLGIRTSFSPVFGRPNAINHPQLFHHHFDRCYVFTIPKCWASCWGFPKLFSKKTLQNWLKMVMGNVCGFYHPQMVGKWWLLRVLESTHSQHRLWRQCDEGSGVRFYRAGLSWVTLTQDEETEECYNVYQF